MNELNSRQWQLYEYLKTTNDWAHLTDLASALEYGELKKGQTFNNSFARRRLTADIQAINNSDVIQKIIICGRKGIKLASKAEAKAYIDKRRAALLRAWQRHHKLEGKAEMDQQMRIVFNKERDTIEAFMRERE